jgi:hypothetical protein
VAGASLSLRKGAIHFVPEWNRVVSAIWKNAVVKKVRAKIGLGRWKPKFILFQNETRQRQQHEKMPSKNENPLCSYHENRRSKKCDHAAMKNVMTDFSMRAARGHPVRFPHWMSVKICQNAAMKTPIHLVQWAAQRRAENLKKCRHEYRKSKTE